MDKKNHPTHINMLINMLCTGNGIGLNASQTLCLIWKLPLIYGDVPKRDTLLLLYIINTVFPISYLQICILKIIRSQNITSWSTIPSVYAKLVLYYMFAV